MNFQVSKFKESMQFTQNEIEGKIGEGRGKKFKSWGENEENLWFPNWFCVTFT